jgi:hypothetical protein
VRGLSPSRKLGFEVRLLEYLGQRLSVNAPDPVLVGTVEKPDDKHFDEQLRFDRRILPLPVPLPGIETGRKTLTHTYLLRLQVGLLPVD